MLSLAYRRYPTAAREVRSSYRPSLQSQSTTEVRFYTLGHTQAGVLFALLVTPIRIKDAVADLKSLSQVPVDEFTDLFVKS